MSDAPRVLLEHEDFIALYKPAGWVVHPVGTDAPDLQRWVQDSVGDGLSPVHRLDAGTSGVVLYAPPVRVERLAARFRDGLVEKTYLALVFGRTRARGTIRRPLQDQRRGRPLPAETRYRTLEHFERWSYLEVRPITGRKHQIRRHLQGIGHALIGDDRYRPRGRPTVPAFPGRLWLHCAAISINGVSIESQLSEELANHLCNLEGRR